MTLLALSLLTPSYACPTIATGTPSELSFDTAQIAIVRQDNRTTFSVSINPAGDPQEFALVMPVPTILAEHEIKTLDPELFTRLDGYSGPRHVYDAGCPYEYDDSYYYGSGDGCGDDTGSWGMADSAGSSSSDPYGSVDVEAEYLVGGYEIVILSAEESDDLFGWLNANGYYLAAGTEERLQEYIDAGSYFMAARVSGDAAAASGASLAPLQVSYESEIFAIPIRLAAMNSPGEQDMVIYAFTEKDGAKDGGQVGIANYAEFEVDDKCIWGETSGDFNDYYSDRFSDAWGAVEAGAWTVEYAGTWNDCSPCSSVSITTKDLIDLGFKRELGESDHHLTRIRMRYTPEQAIEDIVLYGSGLYEPMVTSFADADNTHNATCIPACSVEDEAPVSATIMPAPKGWRDDDECDDGSGLIDGKGCNASSLIVGAGGAPGVMLLLGLLGLARRRAQLLHD